MDECPNENFMCISAEMSLRPTLSAFDGVFSFSAGETATYVVGVTHGRAGMILLKRASTVFLVHCSLHLA